MVTFRSNKKKDRFLHETGLLFVHGDVFKDGSGNSGTFKMEIFAAIGNGRACNHEHYYFHVAAVTRPSLHVKLKLDENCHALKASSDTLSCFVGMFL